MQVEPSDAFQGSDEEGILAEQLARRLALDVAFPKSGIELLQKADLLFRKFDRLPVALLFQLEPAVITTTHLIAVKDLLDGDGAEVGPFQFERVTEPVAASGRILQSQVQDVLFYFWRRSGWMGMMDWW